MSANLDVTAVANASGSDGHCHKVRVYLRYKPANPYEVVIAGNAETTWTFSRDLLIDGLNGLIAGLGDVQVWRQYGRLILRLSVDDRWVRLSLPMPDVRWFVDRMLEAVPYGTERVDVDAWLAGLLRDGTR